MNDYPITVGRVLAPFGIKGQVKVESLSEFPERFASGSQLYAEKLGRLVTVETAAQHSGQLVVKFAEIPDRNAAEALAPTALLISEEQLALLPEGQYYYWELVGLDVYEGENKLGVVAEVLANSANDIYVIEKMDGGELLLPALKSVVLDIALDEGRMTVAVPPGLDD